MTVHEHPVEQDVHAQARQGHHHHRTGTTDTLTRTSQRMGQQDGGKTKTDGLHIAGRDGNDQRIGTDPKKHMARRQEQQEEE